MQEMIVNRFAAKQSVMMQEMIDKVTTATPRGTVDWNSLDPRVDAKEYYQKIPPAWMLTVIKMLKDEEDFLDVTLVCDEESQISAHKVFETPDHLEEHLSTSEILGDAVGLFSLFPGDAPKVQKPSPGGFN